MGTLMVGNLPNGRRDDGVVRVSASTSAEAVLAAMGPEAAGCLLVDVRMSGTDGLDLQAQLAARGVALPVVFVTGYGDVATARRAFRAGAADFLEKPLDPDALLATVERAMAEDRRRRDADAATLDCADRLTRLTAREYEVLDLVCTGRRNREIAAALGVSARTVEVHRARAMEKLEARGLADLLRLRRLVERSAS
jgi:FixJ family two-component response regulator